MIMMQLREHNQRGLTDLGWLKSYHTFSFGEYHDPSHMGFRTLRVMNEDRVQPTGGFPTHPHRDMEILSYVLSGQLRHEDSLGHGSVLGAGEFQRMTAGTGVTHSEFNPSPSQPVHFYQIWIRPEENGLPPSYEQRPFPAHGDGRWALVASREGHEDSLTIHQDVRVYLSSLDAGQRMDYQTPKGRYAWLQVLQGSVQMNQHALVAGDGMAVSEGSPLEMLAVDWAQILLFDLA